MQMQMARRGAGSFLRRRFQVGGAVALTLVLYAMMLIVQPAGPLDVELLSWSGGFCIGAILLGTMLLRSISQYPGVQANAYILPAFALSFGVLLAVLLLARFPYSRLLVFGSFLLTVSWNAFLTTFSGRRRNLCVGVVPGGDHRSLQDISGVFWVPLANPGQSTADIDSIAADLNFDHSDEWERRLADYALSGIPVFHIKQLEESLTGRVALEHLSENSFGTLAPNTAYMTLKHLVDVVSALAASLILGPLLLIVAIWIRVDSPGPAIFRQVRVGYRGRPFEVFKFRTMHHGPSGAGDRQGAQTQAGDHRITRAGAFLRRTRIDELPQILNILRGEMSWIGPRPEAQVLSEWYENEISFYRYRHIVRPGVTGWAQVNQGHVAAVEDVREKLFYDFYYIKQFSPWIDLLIIVKTVRTVITGFGAK